MIRAALVTLACLTHANAADETASLRTLSAEDVFELEWADDPRIAPDGNRVLYARRSFDIMRDRAVSDVWLASLDGSAPEPLLTGIAGLRSPRWSPDGSRIAYVASAGDGRTGLFVHYLASGRTAEIADFSEAPRDLSWSPDSGTLAFTMAVPASSAPLVDGRNKPEGASWADAPKVIDRARYRSDGAGFLEHAYDHVFVIPADGGTARQLTSGDFDHDGPLGFTPDGGRIIFSANRHEGWELETIEADIFSVDIATGALEQLTDHPGAERNPVLSPDGTRLAYIQQDNIPGNPYAMPNLVVAAANGSEPETLTGDFDRRVRDPQWTSDSTIAFSYDDRGHRRVGVADLEGTIEVLVEEISGTTLGRPYVSGTYHARGEAVAFTRGNEYRPADLYTTGDTGIERLTALNEDLLAHRDLAEVTTFTYPSPFDGETIQGWVMTPPGYEEGQRYPLILEIHGGPHSSYGPHFSAELQRMAAAGYVIVYDNHRGSSGYGERFARLLTFKYASKEDFADHMGAVNWAIEEGFADPANLFVAGGSAGGIATAYAVGLTDRFNAAVAAKPVINWVSKTLTADSYIYQQRHQFPGPPWEHLEHYWERSPLSLVGNVSTPTMLITGEEDYRTPMSETEQFYQALQLRGVPTVMVRIPGSSHGIAGRPSRLNAKVDYILAWFERYRAGTDE